MCAAHGTGFAAAQERVYQARKDRVYELDLSFSHLSRYPDHIPDVGAQLVSILFICGPPITVCLHCVHILHTGLIYLGALEHVHQPAHECSRGHWLTEWCNRVLPAIQLLNQVTGKTAIVAILKPK